MSLLARKIQSPDAHLDYRIDWADYLDSPPAADDTILNSEFAFDDDHPQDDTVTLLDGGFTTTHTTFWLTTTGSPIRAIYHIVNTITTVGGRIDRRTQPIQIKEL